MKKITKATLKSFIRKNDDDLYCWEKSSFDGMVDCVMPSDSKIEKVDAGKINFEDGYRLGITGLWLVGRSGDKFEAWENEYFTGIEIYNCCGTSIIATRK